MRDLIAQLTGVSEKLTEDTRLQELVGELMERVQEDLGGPEALQKMFGQLGGGGGFPGFPGFPGFGGADGEIGSPPGEHQQRRDVPFDDLPPDERRRRRDIPYDDRPRDDGGSTSQTD